MASGGWSSRPLRRAWRRRYRGRGNLTGNFVKRDGIVKGEMISFAGLCKMACCNLAESFENSASVTVGYSDAISGARQIKMLGLAGTYTQILDENRPIMRGLSAPYGLSYTPGMWLNSIQVSKGVASVTAGHEAITGQINLEHRKPTDEERLFVNLYLDDELRPEANISTAFPVTKDKKLSSVILLHGSMDTDVRKMDHNHDGFRDLPKSDQINVANKWLYSADNGTQVRWGWKFVQENRLGGMLDFKNTDAMRKDMAENWDWDDRQDKPMPLFTGRTSATATPTAILKSVCPSARRSTIPTSRTRCARTWRSSPTSTTSAKTPISG